MVRIYRVAFYKRLVDSNGHPADPCQGVLEVRGQNRARAVTDARLRFAALKGVSHWSLRADYETVQALSTRKRVSGTAWRRSLREPTNAGASINTLQVRSRC